MGFIRYGARLGVAGDDGAKLNYSLDLIGGVCAH